MILIIDNYDSFTYNVYQQIGVLHPAIKVVRNDQISLADIEQLAPSHIVISPGPGYPSSAGISIDVISHFWDKIPILGVCLGHHAIAEAFGARIVHAKELVHGKKREIKLCMNDETHEPICPIFRGLDASFDAGRYHSLAIADTSLPNDLIITATAPDQTIMGIMHREKPVFGVQFHPESVLTPQGDIIMKNFLSIA